LKRGKKSAKLGNFVKIELVWDGLSLLDVLEK